MHSALLFTCYCKSSCPKGLTSDVGFGNLAPTSALLLAPQIEQETPHELMRFIDVGGELTLQARLKHGWQHIYRVIPYPRYDGEYEITNWYTGTHPETPYQGNIIAAKPGPHRTRITMYNARVTVRDANGQAKRRWLATESEFRDVLRSEFELNMSDEDIDRCVAIMKAKRRGRRPSPVLCLSSPSVTRAVLRCADVFRSSLMTRHSRPSYLSNRARLAKSSDESYCTP